MLFLLLQTSYKVIIMSKVSIIMPSFNKEKYISRSIESILNQTFKDWELLIIDDASTDKSVDIIKSYRDSRIKFFQNKSNIGIAGTRNIGLLKAQGEYIALLDADDLSTDFRIEKEVEFLDNNLNVDVVFGDFRIIDENDVVKETYFTPLRNPNFIKAKLMVRDVIPNGSCMYRKEFVRRNNIQYRDGYLGMDDYLFWVECSFCGKIIGMSDLFLYWRDVQENSTKLYKDSERYKKERKLKYAQIHKYALDKMGFSLTEEELVLYNQIFDEDKYEITSREEIIKMYDLIKKICKQSRNMDISLEVQQVYKKYFGLFLEKSYIWDD